MRISYFLKMEKKDSVPPFSPFYSPSDPNLFKQPHPPLFQQAADAEHHYADQQHQDKSNSRIKL